MDSVKSYLRSRTNAPYFLFVGDKRYTSVLDELKVRGLDCVPMSGFCSGEDKIPDVDGLLDYIESADVNEKGKKFVVTGLGEYLALRGIGEAARVASRLKDLKVGGARVVLLLRGLSSLIAGLESDPRFDDRRHSVVDNAECDLSFTLAAPSIGLPALSGFKAMLAAMENGRNGNIAVATAVSLDKALFTVHSIRSAYDGIKSLVRGFTPERSCGSDAFWAELLKELSQSGGSLDAVFDKQGLGGNPETDFYKRIADGDYQSWLYFIRLKSQSGSLQNSYLRFVLDTTERFEDFARNILNEIIEISPRDARFAVFYKERCELVEKFPESDIADFVVNNRRVSSESIYRLTDGTGAEREEIIGWVSKNEPVPHLENIYPALAAYLKKYTFTCPNLAELLTEYFEAYKRQKLSNRIEPEFLEKVAEFARSRPFNPLPTREAIVEQVDKNGTHLYWLDALGVEYLALIEALSRKKGLSMRINIARAELPTVTDINRKFYDIWPGSKEKNNELDDVKHNSVGGYNFTTNELPLHLAKELSIITTMMDKAATMLALRRCKRFLIVSDHGASRLAVLRRQEEKYNTDTVGEHSGRCCKLFQPHDDLPYAVEENNYLVLADYGRFKGSRAANVEVHGGAALEEVVVPVIELSLKDANVAVKLVEETVTVDSRLGAMITLFCNSPLEDVSVELDGKRYPAERTDDNHYTARLSGLRRAGVRSAHVYAGDNLINEISIKAQGKSAKVDDSFDSLF